MLTDNFSSIMFPSYSRMAEGASASIRRATSWNRKILRWWLPLAVIALSAGGAAAQTRIMPVGNSITDGDGSANGLGYRDDLYELLQDGGWDFKFVGDCGEAPYQGHFAQGGTIVEFYPPGFGSGWGNGVHDISPAMTACAPEILLIHLGTNDLPAEPPPHGPYSTDGGQSFLPNACGQLAELLLYLLQWAGGQAGSELETIVLCQITPIRDREAEVLSFNGYLVEMAADYNTGIVTGRPEHIVICDQFSPFMDNPLLFTGLPGDYMADAIHPSDDGYHVMAESFLASLSDNTPPASIADLDVTGNSCYEATLSWTAVGDDVLWGVAGRYEGRLAPFPMSPATFPTGFELTDLPPPGPPGSLQQRVVPGLPDGAVSWFVLRTWDDGGNASGLSNASSVSTPSAPSRYEAFSEGWESRWFADSCYTVENGYLTTVPGQSAWAPATAYVAAKDVDQVGIIWHSHGSRVALLFLEQLEPPHDGWGVAWQDDSLQLVTVEDGVLHESGVTESIPPPPLSPGDSLEAIMVRSPERTSWWCYHNNNCLAVLDAPVATTLAAGGIALCPTDPASLAQFYMKGRQLDPAPSEFSLLWPADGDTIESLQPTFVWESARDSSQAVTYSLYADTTAAFDSPVCYCVEGIPDTSATCVHPLPVVPMFWWKVIAVDASGLETTCSKLYSFWVRAALPAPEEVHQNSQAQLRLLENPVHRQLSAVVRCPPGTASLSLHDVTGRLVWRRRLTEANRLDSTISFALDQPPGVYFLRLQRAGTSVAARFVVTR